MVVDWWLGLAISAWWWLGLANLGVVVPWACRSCGSWPGFANLGLGLPFFFLFSDLKTTTTAHKRPNPLATPRRRDPPRWPHREGEIHPAGHTAKDLTSLATPSLAVPISTVWRWWSHANLGLEEWVSAWRWWSRANWLLRN